MKLEEIVGLLVALVILMFVFAAGLFVGIGWTTIMFRRPDVRNKLIAKWEEQDRRGGM